MEREGNSCPKCGNKNYKIVEEKNNSFGVIEYRQCDKADCGRKYKVQVYQNKKIEANDSNFILK